jgi:predicted Ser/Thr protein kinase
MGNEIATGPHDPDDRLYEAIASFEDALGAGLNPDPAEWLVRYPDVAERLREHFSAAGWLQLLAEPPPEAPAPPPTVKGYRVLDRLGKGGMGMVYRAVQEGPDRVVALKVIRPDRLDGLSPEQRGDAVRRFETESRAAARLGHPNIVPVFEVGEVEGRPFYSMQYVLGASLADLVESAPLEPRRAAAYLEQVARAVHEAHRHGILHRDLKPENILVESGTDRVFVADFGLAKLAQEGAEGTRTGAVMGTPPYMSPEQAQDSARVTVASDVYSLGATLYALITGHPPFPGKEPPAVKLRRVIEEEPVPPRRLRPDLPRDLETICLKCLHKDPQKRYASADELAGRLRLYLEGRPIPDRPTGKVERAWRWCRRNPALAAALTVAVALLLGGTAVSSYFALAEAAQAETARKEKKAAVAARDKLEKSEAQLRKKLDELQRTTGRGLLRPFTSRNVQPGVALTLTVPEIEALWELASLPDEGVRRRFVSEALQRPGFTRQLRIRAELAMHAAVGLDARQREVVEGLLLERLQQEAVSEEQRTDIALVAASLGDLSPRAAAAAGRALTQAMTNAPPELAAELVGGEKVSRWATGPFALRELAWGLSALAARLDPKGAAQAASTLTGAMTKTTDPFARHALAVRLSALAARLDPNGAARAAETLTQAITKSTDPSAVLELARGLSALAARLDPKEAARHCAPAASALTQAMAAMTKTGPFALRELVGRLSAVAARLDPEEAAQHCARAATILTQAMANLDPNASLELAVELSTVAARLDPKEAARHYAWAASALTQAMTKPTQPFALGRLAGRLSAVAARLDPKEAARHCAPAATTLTQAISKTTSPTHLFATDLSALAEGLSAVAARLDPEEAARHCAPAATTLTQAISKTTDFFALRELARGLSAVAARLDPKEAARHCAPAASALTKAMTKNTDPDTLDYGTLGDLARVLSAVAARLDPKEAAQHCARAATTLTQAMTKTTDPKALNSLAEGLSAVAARLDPKEAAQHCARAATTFTQAMTKTIDRGTLNFLAWGLSALAARLDPKEAASTLLQAIANTPVSYAPVPGDPDGLSSLAKGLSATLTRDLRDLPVRAAGLVASVGVGECQPFLATTATVLALEPLPCRLSTQELVDLLKDPFCVNQARRVVLKQLERRYRRTFADHWEFVRFAQQQNLGLDFTTPPRRTEPLPPEARR